MRSSKEFFPAQANKVDREALAEMSKEYRFEQAAKAHKLAIKTVPIFCDDRLDKLFEAEVSKKGKDAFPMRMPCHLFIDELGNKHLKWISKTTHPKFTKKRGKAGNEFYSYIEREDIEYYYATGDPLDYKTFQTFMRKHGFSVTDTRERFSYTDYYLGEKRGNIISIDIISPKTKEE